MIITKYAVIDAPLKNGTRGGAFDPSALSYALQDDLACTIFDNELEAKNAIMESGFQAHTYLVPLTIDTEAICQIKLVFESAFE